MKKKKKLQYLRQLVGVRYCGIFLPGNSIRPESKEIMEVGGCTNKDIRNPKVPCL